MNKSFEAQLDGVAVNPLAGIPSVKARVSIYVPSTMDGDPAGSLVIKYQRDKVAESLSRWFNGFTEIEGRGGWYSEKKGRLEIEPIYVIYAGCEPAALARCLPSVVRLAGDVARAMFQECVTLDVNGVLYFVPPSASWSEADASPATNVV